MMTGSRLIVTELPPTFCDAGPTGRCFAGLPCLFCGTLGNGDGSDGLTGVLVARRDGAGAAVDEELVVFGGLVEQGQSYFIC